MNDISVKIVESPKEVVVESAPPTENVVNDEDPLAIDEESGRVNEAETPVAEKAGTCDENAKDESEFGTPKENSVKSITLQSEIIKEDLLEEDAGSINSKVEETDTSRTLNDEGSSKFLTPDVNAPIPDLDTSLETLDEPEQCSVEESFAETSIYIAEITESKSVDKEPNSLKEEVQPLFLEVSKVQEVTVTVPEIPEVAKTPEVSKTPEVLPEIVKAAEVTQALEVTKAPEVRKTLEVVKTPEVIKLLGLAKIQEVPKVKEVTRLPEVVKVTEVAKSAEVTRVPEVIKVPEVSKVPEVVNVREVAKSIEISKQTAPKAQEQMPMALEVPKVEPLVPKVEKKEKSEGKVVSLDVEMMEVAPVAEKKSVPAAVAVEKPKFDERMEQKEKIMPLNGDIAKDEQATKRRASADVDTESPLKKLCLEVENTFPQHDSMINDYIQTATKNNIDEIQRHTEQLLAEIQTLRELAQKKEHEWNNILHLKKVKEEILLRLLRRKQVLSFEKSAEMNGSERTDPFDFLNQAKNLAIDKSDEISGLAIKQPGSTMSPIVQPVMPVTTHFNPMAVLPPPYDKAAHMQNMPKPVFQPMMLPGPMPGFPRDMNGQLPNSYGLPMGRQGPTKDVKSIIADYRQRNPDVTPRRGRRMKSLLNPNMMNAPRPIAPKLDSMNSLSNLNMLFNNLDMNQKAMLERLQQMQAGNLPNSIFKDALVQFANMQQATSGLIPNRIETVTNRQEHHKERRRPERTHEEHKQPERPSTSPRLPPPPPYPEISLLPVTTSQETTHTQQQNSLLHGILTKHAPGQSYAPTLAKLLTSPERQQALPAFGQAKNCGEITITPVQPTPPPPEPQPEKTEEVVQLDDEESAVSEGEASGSPPGSGSGRLVIDEGNAEASETPLCQGCRRRDAQFVCAGCANQWYCSRDCQVAAWDEHSEMCSG